jgi:hypothetical protein
MADAPITLEGWYTLHEMYADWALGTLAPAERDDRHGAASLLEARGAPRRGHSACWSLLTQKGVLWSHWRRDLEALRRERVALARTGCVVPPADVLLSRRRGARDPSLPATPARAGPTWLEPGADPHDAALTEGCRRSRGHDSSPTCRRAAVALSHVEAPRRARQLVRPADGALRLHARSARSDGAMPARSLQVIQGSVGLDDRGMGRRLRRRPVGFHTRTLRHAQARRHGGASDPSLVASGLID